MKGAFVSVDSKRLNDLVRHIVSEVNDITINSLMLKSPTVPKPQDVMMNEYMVMMQVVSHSMMSILSRTKEATQMISATTDEEAKKFYNMTEEERKKWADELYDKTIRKDKDE